MIRLNWSHTCSKYVLCMYADMIVKLAATDPYHLSDAPFISFPWKLLAKGVLTSRFASTVLNLPPAPRVPRARACPYKSDLMGRVANMASFSLPLCRTLSLSLFLSL